MTYHDSAFLRRPKDYNRLWHLMFRLINLPAVRRADAILTISRFSASEIEALLPESRGKVHSIHLGISPQMTAPKGTS